MSIKIMVNLSHPSFAGQDPKKIAVSLNVIGQVPMFLYNRYELTHQSVGDAAVNPRTLMVSSTRPLEMTDQELGLWGSNATHVATAGRVMAVLADYVRRGVLIVAQNGTPLTSEQLLTFTPT